MVGSDISSGTKLQRALLGHLQNNKEKNISGCWKKTKQKHGVKQDEKS